MKINIKKEKCIGCGTCEVMCPRVFKLDSQTFKAEVIEDALTDQCDLGQVAKSCPVEAIRVKE